MTFADFVERPIHVSPLLFERHDGKYILRHKQLHGELDDGFGVVLRLATDFVELLVSLALSRIYDAKVTQFLDINLLAGAPETWHTDDGSSCPVSPVPCEIGAFGSAHEDHDVRVFDLLGHTQLGMRHFPVREGRRAKCPAVVCASNISLPIAD